MDLRQQLQLKLSHSDYHDIAQLMGYKSKSGKAAQRITDVLADRYLGLYSGGFDFKYRSDEFISALCSVLGLSISDYKNDLDAIHGEYLDRRDRYKSYVFVDTEFKRKSQPVCVLAFCEGMRYIELDYEIRVKPMHEQVKYVQSLVAQHYKDTKGKISIWGDVRRYVFFYAEGCKLAISLDGVIINEPEEVSIGKATLTVGGADITKLATGEKMSPEDM